MDSGFSRSRSTKRRNQEVERNVAVAYLPAKHQEAIRPLTTANHLWTPIPQRRGYWLSPIFHTPQSMTARSYPSMMSRVLYFHSQLVALQEAHLGYLVPHLVVPPSLTQDHTRIISLSASRILKVHKTTSVILGQGLECYETLCSSIAL